MMNKLLRRFSTTDITGDNNDSEKNELILKKNMHQNAQLPLQQQQQQQQQQQSQYPKKSNISPSAPSSPTSSSKTISFTSMMSVMSVAKDMMSVATTNVTNTVANSTSKVYRQPTLTKEKAKILFVIGDCNIDWSRYFRNKKIHDTDIRVEQAGFKDINISSYTDVGAMVDILVDRNGNKIVKSFRPDFLLIREHARNFDNDWRRILIALKYGNIPSVNSIDSIYNFCDKPWVFSQLIQIQKKYGQEAFPLINQTYHPDYREMIRSSFPCIVKVGHAHHGLGKIKVDNLLDLQDVGSIVSISGSYATTEPFIDSKCDIHIQKIGENYKAYMRRSITGNWKVNNGSSMLEQIPMNDRYKFWVDEVSKIFGGLDICAVQVVVSLDQEKEFIVDAADSCLTLLGESQESDRKQIADLIIDKMTHHFFSAADINLSLRNAPISSQPLFHSVNSNSNSSLKSNQNDVTGMNDSMSKLITPATSTQSVKIDSNRPQSPNRSNSTNLSHSHVPPPLPPPPNIPINKRTQPSLPSHPIANNNINNNNITQNQVRHNDKPILNHSTSLNKNNANTDESEDTMNNLRRTFAGIFGNSDL